MGVDASMTDDADATPATPDPDDHVARLQAQIDEVEAHRAGYRAEARATVARGGPVRPTDEELGIIKTDDTVGRIAADTEAVWSRLSRLMSRFGRSKIARQATPAALTQDIGHLLVSSLSRQTPSAGGLSAAGDARPRPGTEPSSPVRSKGCQPLVHLKGVALDLIGQQHSAVAHGRDCGAGQLDGAVVRLCAEGSVVCASDPPRRGDSGPVTVLETVASYLELQVPDGRTEVLGPLLECLATSFCGPRK